MRARADRLKGDPDNPLSWDEFAAKFDGLAAELLPTERRARLVAIAREMERHPVAAFTELLSTGR